MTRRKQLEAFLEDDPSDTFVLFALAQELAKTGQAEEARQRYLELKKIDPDYVGLYYHLAGLEISMDLLKAAIATYEEGIAVARRLGDAHALAELQGALLACRENL